MRETIALNYGWEFYPNVASYQQLQLAQASSKQLIDIPHNMHDIALNNFDETSYQYQSAYRKVLPSEQIVQAEHALLTFQGVANCAHVWVNGAHATSNYCSYLPFTVDLRAAAEHSDTVELVVIVDAREDPTVPPFGYVVDYLTYGGIYREVDLELVSAVHIENCQILTPDVTKNAGQVSAKVMLANLGEDVFQGELNFSLFDSSDTLVAHGCQAVAFSSSETTELIDIWCDNAERWELDNPALYSLQLELTSEQQLKDTRKYRFGFREVSFQQQGFYLNGRLTKLIGLNRHQSFPYVGYAMPKSAQVRDADILKQELGCNCVRSSHYPPSKHFLNRCDEIGLLVFNEIPGWQHISDKTVWRERTIDNVRRMVMRDWNHPSIFIWGVRINESPDCNELYTETNRVARELDPTRPTGGVRCIKNSELLEDVYTYNDFSHTGDNAGLEPPRQVVGKSAPYLVSEHNGHMFPTKAFDSQDRLLSHALRHARVIDDAFKQYGQAGAIGWCMSDYNTHEDFGSGDGICYHGVLDIFREPKYAAGVYSSQQSKTPVMTLASNTRNGDYAKAQFGAITLFTNCAYVKLYKNGEYINTFYPDVTSFSHMPNAPILIDDFIGDQLASNEPFSAGDAEQIRQLFRVIVRSGVEGLAIGQRLNLLYRMKKNRLSEQDMVELFTRYIGNWGEETATYKVEGYQNDQCVITQSFGKSRLSSLQLHADQTRLCHAETYDVTRIVVRVVDEDNRIKNYANNPLEITASPELQILGPNKVSLSAGRVAFWVRTTGLKGQGTVTVSTPQFGSHSITLDLV